MQDITNQPATVGEWFRRFVLARRTDPVAAACRNLTALDPSGLALNSLDQRAWQTYLAVKKAKGLVIEEEGK